MATIRVQPTSSDFVAITVIQRDPSGREKMTQQILLTPEFASGRFIELVHETCKLIELRRISKGLENQKDPITLDPLDLSEEDL